MNDNKLPMMNGDFQLVSGIDEIKQQITVALNTFYGDWVLDYTKGIDYAYGVRHEEFLEHDVKNQIRGVKGVLSVDDFTMDYDKTNLTLNISAVVKTTYGKLDLRSSINI
mgnify:CR=1 FL=1